MDLAFEKYISLSFEDPVAIKVRPFDRINSKKYITPHTFNCLLFLLVFALYHSLIFYIFSCLLR